MEEKIESILPSVSANMQETVKYALRLARTPIRGAVLVRALNNIMHTVELLDIESLENIAGSSSNLDVLLSLFEQNTFLESQTPFDKDPLRSVRLEGIRARNKLLKKHGGVITSTQAAGLLGISRQAVDKRRKQGKLLAVSPGKRGYFYPVWQFSENGIIPGFEDVLAILKDYDPWMKMIFMLNANDRLENRSPLEILREGDLDKVLQAARATGEQGAL